MLPALAAACDRMIATRTSPAAFPMAPCVEEWEALSPAERAAVVAAPPGEVSYDEMPMPEGDRDRHSKAKARALDALRGYFTRQRRRMLVTRNQLLAYRLASPDAEVYPPILPNHGMYESQVLGLEVQVERDRLRFYAGTALLLEREELIVRLQAMADDAQRRAVEEAQLREEEKQRREEAERLREEEQRRREEAERLRHEEARRREEAEQEVARLRAELERLKR